MERVHESLHSLFRNVYADCKIRFLGLQQLLQLALPDIHFSSLSFADVLGTVALLAFIFDNDFVLLCSILYVLFHLVVVSLDLRGWVNLDLLPRQLMLQTESS